jgi:hypothetical protein
MTFPNNKLLYKYLNVYYKITKLSKVYIEIINFFVRVMEILEIVVLEKEEFDAYLELVQAALKLLQKHENACNLTKKGGAKNVR